MNPFRLHPPLFRPRFSGPSFGAHAPHQSAAGGAAPFNLVCKTQPVIAVAKGLLDIRNLRGSSRRLCAAMQYEILFIFQKESRAAIE
jgi:hypothetical protein